MGELARKTGGVLGAAAIASFGLSVIVVYGTGIVLAYPVYWGVRALGAEGLSGAITAAEVAWLLRVVLVVGVIWWGWYHVRDPRHAPSSQKCPAILAVVGWGFVGLWLAVVVIGSLSYGDLFSAMHVFGVEQPAATAVFTSATSVPPSIKVLQNIVFMACWLAVPVLAVRRRATPSG